MWGSELWGTLVWGAVSVPTMPFGMLLLMVGCFLAGGYFLEPGRRTRRSVLVLALLVAIPFSIAAVSVPHTFTNGTIAEAGEVNANFDALVDAANDLRTGLYQAGVTPPVPYSVDHERYVVEALPGDVGVVVPIDITLMDGLCRDLDGCDVSVAMLYSNPAELGNTPHRRFHLFRSEVDGWWRTNGDIAGIQANAVVSEFIFYDCLFTDAETQSGGPNGRVDLNDAFGLLNLSGGAAPDETTSCRLVVED